MYNFDITKEDSFMNLKRRFLCFFVAFVMVVGLSAVCPGALKAARKESMAILNQKVFPIVKKPITLKIFIKKTVNMANPKDILLFREYEKKTGIKINWISVDDTSVKEKLALSLASQDLPDAYMRANISKIDQFRYGAQGLLVDLNKEGLFKKYAPHAYKFINKYKDVKQSVMYTNGAIYALPEGVESTACRVSKKLFINAAWLKKVGKKAPTTTDELYDVLKAFKEKDPNGNGKADEIPLTASGKISNVTICLEGAFGLGNHGVNSESIDLDPKTKKIRFIPASPQYKELLAYMRKLYQEGLIDQEIFSNNMAQFIGKGMEGLVGTFAAINNANMPSNHLSEYVGLSSALKGPHGDKIWAPMRPHLAATGTFAITSANKYPEATLRWIDYFYTDEGTRLYYFGVEGKTCKKIAKGKYDWADSIYEEVKKSKTNFDSVVGKYTPYLGGNNPAIIKDGLFGGREMEAVSYKAAMDLLPFVPKKIWPFFTYTQAENDRLVVLKTDIHGYVNKMMAEFIFGTTPLTEWDNYLKQLKKMHLDEMLRIYQTVYQRYLKS
jgi:putative aldouronate transport system substrate-binding protein